MDLSDLRREYVHAELDEKRVASDPIVQFQLWLEQAIAAGVLEPTAMTLATADAEGRTSARIVLLKQCDERGFVFYTNYESRKARELALNPHAALLFHWPELDRQVRVEGTAEKTSQEESRAYFGTRPLRSQLSAWASRQSAPIAGRAELERAFVEAGERFGERPVPLPPFWGGYRVVAESIELWQGRRDRLHDRLRYRRLPTGSACGWSIERLSP
jgi:pyridoxamine 5'-phosphate oxidase